MCLILPNETYLINILILQVKELMTEEIKKQPVEDTEGSRGEFEEKEAS